MKSFIQNYLDFQNYITSTTIWGWLPLDIVSHFIGGAFITIILLKCKFNFKQVFLSVVILAISKELCDFFLAGKTMVLESLKDILVTCSYPILLWGVRRLQKKLNHSSNRQT